LEGNANYWTVRGLWDAIQNSIAFTPTALKAPARPLMAQATLAAFRENPWTASTPNAKTVNASKPMAPE